MIPRDLSTALSEIQRSALIDLHVACPGKIQTYSATTQTATIVLGIKPQIPDDTGLLQEEEPPVLIDVPVLFPRSASMFLTFPLAAGDSVLVIFCDRNIGQWRALGDQTVSADGEVMGMSGAVAIPGLFPDKTALTGVSTSDAVLGAQGGVQIHVKSGGTVEVTSSGGATADDFVAMAGKVKSELDGIKADLDALKTWTSTHVHAGVTAGVATSGVATSVVLTYAATTPASSNLKAKN